MSLVTKVSFAIMILACTGTVHADRVKFKYQLGDMHVRIILEGPDIVAGQTSYSSATLSDYTIGLAWSQDGGIYNWSVEPDVTGDFNLTLGAGDWSDDRWEFAWVRGFTPYIYYYSFNHRKQGKTHYVELTSDDTPLMSIQDTEATIRNAWDEVPSDTYPAFEPNYELKIVQVDIPPNTHYKTAFAGINNAGQIVGSTNVTAPESKSIAFIYDDGAVTPIEAVGGPGDGSSPVITGRDISPNGTIAGSATTPWIQRPYLYGFSFQDGVRRMLPFTGVGHVNGEGVNDAGDVVGYYHFPEPSDPTYSWDHAFIWHRGDSALTDITPVGYCCSRAWAINAAGEVVGDAIYGDNKFASHQAFHWQDGVMTDLSEEGDNLSSAVEINEAGQILGWRRYIPEPGAAYHYRAFIYEDGARTDLGLIDGEISFDVTPRAMSENGMVIGRTTVQELSGFTDHEFIWVDGYMYDLTRLVKPLFDAAGIDSTGLRVTGINDRGQIVGYAIYDYVGFILIPQGTVDIDVLPDDQANKIYPNKGGKFPVAVLSGPAFDATQVDPSTVKFGLGEASPANAPIISDVDGLHGDDTTLKFWMEDSGIFCNDTEVTMSGETYAGDSFTGTDTIDATDCVTGGCHPY
jgi:probable HAF family extracellular repeat protein